MNRIQEKNLFHLAGKQNFSELPVETWQHLAEAYPYFAPVQFFLAAKLKQAGNATAASQVIKTNIYFSNPYWLEFLLQEQPVNKSKRPAGETAQKEEVEYIPTAEAVKIRTQNIVHTNTGADELKERPSDEKKSIKSSTITDSGTVENKISSILSEQLANFKKPVGEDAKLDIEAEERLHTIDYFASQGIRIDLSKIPQDKLTTNLRKFTDWLKQMKNPETGITDMGTNIEMENAVAEIARISNVNKEVLTEAMAEVLVKQGQIEKAIQLFIKLSFLNPEKSSYFAARIEQLKGI